MADTQGKMEKLNSKRYIIYLIIFIAISILTLFYIYRFFGQPTSFMVLGTFPANLLIGLAGLLLIYFLLDGLRLYFILRSLAIDVSFGHIFKIVFINLFISNITPFASGGGVAQVYFLTQKGIALGDATAATTLRTVLASLFVFVSAPIVLLTNQSIFDSFSNAPVFIYLLVFLVLYLVIFYIAIFKNRFIKKTVFVSIRFLKRKKLLSNQRYHSFLKYLFKHIEMFGEKLALFLKGKTSYVILSFLFTACFLLAEFTFAILLLEGMGYQIDYFSVILMQVVVIFFMYFAPTPGATGVAEGGFSLLFSRIVSEGDIFPLIFSWRLFTKYIGIAIGIIVFYVMLLKGDKKDGK